MTFDSLTGVPFPRVRTSHDEEISAAPGGQSGADAYDLIERRAKIDAVFADNDGDPKRSS